MISWSPQSLRWRILAWHSLTLSLVVTSFALLLYSRLRQAKFHEVDLELEGVGQALVQVLNAVPPHELEWDRPFGSPIGPAGGPAGGPPGGRLSEEPGHLRPRPGDRRPGPQQLHDAMRAQIERLDQTLELPESFRRRYGEGAEERPYFVVWRQAGDVLKASEQTPPGALNPPSADWLPDGAIRAVRQADGWRRLYLAGPRGSRLVVARSMRRELDELRQWAFWISGSGAACVAIGLAGGWWISKSVLRSIRRISDAAAAMSEQTLSQPIDTRGVDTELGSLANTLNRTFSRLAAAFARQRQFTDDASHELRTPLTVILGNLSLALSAPSTPESLKGPLQAATRAARRMKSLTEHLLVLARADAGALSVEHDPFDLSDTVHECVDLLRPLADKKEIRLQLTAPPAEMLGDQRLLAQVVINLTSNAIHYGRLGGQVRVDVVCREHDVTLTVDDDGVGIPSELHDRVFERFFRADEARTRQTGGCGLGLAICKTIVEAHDGEIDFRSEQGRGTQFIVRLPRGEIRSTSSTDDFADRSSPASTV